jgi:hypothetical protein
LINNILFDSEINIGKGGTKVAVGDLNKDNLLDIVIVGVDSIKVFLQNTLKK